MPKNTKMLTLSSDPTMGTDFYRTTGVFNRLPVEMIRPSGGMFSWATLADIDILYVQRPATQTEVVYLEIAKKYKKPILLDYDDDPLHLNEDNPVYDIWNRDDKRACVKQCLLLADIVMVSTQALKESLLELTPNVDIRVVPNAQDDLLFDFNPSYHERNKIIVMRGGSSHKNDWGGYKDGILEIMNDNPDYTLAVMGYSPEWLREIPSKQLQLHEFKDIPTYFDNLMKLRPQIGLVPLSDNKFNRAKSNIGFQEFVMAGAAVMASDLPEFDGSVQFRDNTSLVECFNYLKSDIHANHRQLSFVPKLSNVNQLREDIIEELKNQTKKYSPHTQERQPATDQEFHEYSLAHGHTQDYPEFRKLHDNVAQWLVKTLNPKTSFEIGCGTGATMLGLLNRGVMAYGIEINPYSYEYFKDHHPMHANQITLGDITTESLVTDTVGDLVYSFEVFEHIDMPEEWWINFLTDLSTKFKHFYFSSTPYHENESWDHFWGHKNLRITSNWIKLFEQSGWKFVSNPKVLVNWDLLFSSKLA